MSVYQTVYARKQLRELRAFYLEKERYDAYRNLMNAIREAKRQIEADPYEGAPHPKPYPRLAARGYLWIKVHRYWFGWSMRRGFPVITNVLFVTANMPRRIAPDKGPLS
jgi:hypothetical protein